MAKAYEIGWCFHRKWSWKPIPEERRGFRYSAWSGNQPTVSDPAGIADMAEVWWTGKHLMLHLSLFRS